MTEPVDETEAEFEAETTSDSASESSDESSSNPDAIELTFEEARVLGCLLEKEATTPDHYPLTLNALVSACNQSSNRDPVVGFESSLVEQTIEDLRYNGLGMLVHQAGARVPKFKHTLDNKLPYLSEGQRALICVLLLRGQQTSGELRQRCERMHHFSDVASVEATLDSLFHYDPLPLVKKFPAGGGRRVPSYAHLFSGEPADHADAHVQAAAVVSDSVIESPTWRATLENRVDELETEVADLKSQLDQLRADLGA